ncbi:monogalactosyldiacylglycerol synthase [Vigna angularis]|uniref:Monogalactosyldiacylglycerol synthase n=1 Tax=Phaseolus angularis TaxID=3914 RepID=A0A8T0JRA8_PHAAN|nr:monogalactosyldiacylglycerol synthase [Vigna angularis]
MNNGVRQESSVLLDLASHVNRFAFDHFRTDTAVQSSFLRFNGGAGAKRGVSLRVSLREDPDWVRLAASRGGRRCGGGGGGCDGDGDGSGVRVDECGRVENEGLRGNGVGGERPKKVLILMSDTGGGHRASAEAIKAAFYEDLLGEISRLELVGWKNETAQKHLLEVDDLAVVMNSKHQPRCIIEFISQKLMSWDKKMNQGTLLEEAYKYVRFLQAQFRLLQSMPSHSSSSSPSFCQNSTVFLAFSFEQFSLLRRIIR